MGGDEIKAGKEVWITIVSIHAPVWGATCSTIATEGMLEFQSTPPYGGRHLVGGVSVLDGVSIHAPVWGATHDLAALELVGLVSIHAPVWGATWDGVAGRSNSETVSIHAPVWGATPPASVLLQYHIVSIHAPVWGATLLHIQFPPGYRFQSTPPYGGRP